MKWRAKSGLRISGLGQTPLANQVWRSTQRQLNETETLTLSRCCCCWRDFVAASYGLNVWQRDKCGYKNLQSSNSPNESETKAPTRQTQTEPESELEVKRKTCNFHFNTQQLSARGRLRSHNHNSKPMWHAACGMAKREVVAVTIAAATRSMAYQTSETPMRF